MSLLVKVQRTNNWTKMPVYSTDGAGCFDLASTYGGVVPAHGSEVFTTSLKFEIPDGYVMHIYSRSGHGFKSDIRLANCVGIIDSDYRGEVTVKLTNDGDTPFVVSPGDRIAQATVTAVPRVFFHRVDELSETDRGTGGLGSTGR